MQESQNVIKKYSTPLIIGGVLLGGYIVYRLFRKKADTSEQAVSKDKKYFIKQGQSYNYPLSTYVAFADSIYNAFHLNTNIFNSVDERKIISIMKKMYNEFARESKIGGGGNNVQERLRISQNCFVELLSFDRSIGYQLGF